MGKWERLKERIKRDMDIYGKELKCVLGEHYEQVARGRWLECYELFETMCQLEREERGV
ncbi:MAG: hypothetical protein DDT19_01767 [Syntrophomonadaceae bacterium]|nr:hypothetical protein [Bacillota bacterium]